jgi:hypothetical protein
VTENDFNRVPETNETSFVLLEKLTSNAIKIACYLPGGKALLPLPEGVARLDNLLAYNVWKSPLGSVLEEGPGLVMFDAHYGPGPTLDAPPGRNGEDLKTPEREQPALDQIVADLNLEGQNTDQAMQTLARFFSTQFTYSTWYKQDRSYHHSESALTRFLLHSRTGHCEYFATAAVLLFRSIGIEARYAVGYAVQEGSGQSYVVRQRDAHAWCLVWDKGRKAWRDFDPTPGVWLDAEDLKPSWTQRIADLWARVTFEISKFRWGQSHVREYLLWAVLPILGLLLYQILFRTRHRRRGAKKGEADDEASWPGMDSEFYELERQLGARGLDRNPSEPTGEWLIRVAKEPSLGEIRDLLKALLQLHYRYRFDPEGLGPDDREALRQTATTCLAILEHWPRELVEQR